MIQQRPLLVQAELVKNSTVPARWYFTIIRISSYGDNELTKREFMTMLKWRGIPFQKRLSFIKMLKKSTPEIHVL